MQGIVRSAVHSLTVGGLALAIVAVAYAPARAANIVYGYVQHVSTTNLKIQQSHTKQSLSFLLVPKFDQIFSSDGKTTYQMKDVKAGTFVKVYYDQKGLGARHADKIYIYRSGSPIPSGAQ
jgi:hypothetical protein